MNKNSNMFTMENICRTCLTKGNDLQPLFLDEDLIFKIKIISSVQVNKIENLPSKICKHCTENVYNFYLFREKIINSDKLLKEQFEEVLNKEELQEDSASDQPKLSISIYKVETVEQDRTGENTTDQPEFSCEMCNYKTRNRGSYWNHTKFAHEPRTKCEYCKKTVKNYNLVYHMQEYHPNVQFDVKNMEESNKTLEDLHKKFDETDSCSEDLLDNEARDVSDSDAELDNLQSSCGNSTVDEEESHNNSHEKHEFDCSTCKYTAPNRTAFWRHKSKHDPQSTCKFCNKAIKTNNMVCHMKKYHFQEWVKTAALRQYSCSACSFRTSNKRLFWAHKLKHESKISCNVCGKYIKKDNMDQHLKLHKNSSLNPVQDSLFIKFEVNEKEDEIRGTSDEEKYSKQEPEDEEVKQNVSDEECDGGSDVCLGDEDLAAEVSHKSKDITEQDSDFSSKANDAKGKLVTLESGEKVYICDVCNFQTPNKTTFWNHKFKHMPKSACSICGKSLRTNYMSRHMKAHVLESIADNIGSKVENCDLETSDNYVEKQKKIEFDDATPEVKNKPEDLSLEEQNKIYSCDVCNYETTKRTTFYTHKYGHLPKIECSVCGMSVRKDNMKKHLNSHSDDDKKVYFCEICSYQTTKRTTFYTHKIGHMPKIECQVCGVNVRKDNMTRHLASHTNEEKNKVYSCDVCNFQTTKRTSFNSHKIGHLPKTVCSICGISFRKDYLPKHMRLHLIKSTKANVKTASQGVKKKRVRRHEKKRLTFVIESDKDGNKTYSCKKCDYKTNHQEEMNKHKSTHVARSICSICGMLVTSYNMSNHLKTHLGERVTCGICGRVFKNAISYQTHPLMHIPEENTCEKCGKKCFFKGEFIRHMKLHKEKKRKFKCDLCEKAFTDKQTLEKHIRSHTGERPYPCEYCGKKFSSPYALKTHTRQHTNERPYACDLCPMAFPQRVSLRTHMKSRHNIEMKKAATL